MVNKDQGALAAIKGVELIVDKKFFPDGITDFSGHTRAFLKIQDGCDNSCAYCKVPLVRGRSRSRSICDVAMEADTLAQKGHKEIVLTGICLGAYGRDLKPKTSLAKLICKLEKIEGLERIRLSSIEAGDVTEELIDKLSKSPKLCQHLHIPIQSGDDKILKLMRRRYTRKYYLHLISLLRRKIPDISITTDVMVGFPGESEENFNNTLRLIRAISPLKAHIFPYSARPGTVALGLGSVIPPEIIRRRAGRLRLLAERYSLEFKKRFLKRVMPVLIESRAGDSRAFWEGHTGNYLKARTRSRLDLSGSVLPVKLIRLKKDCFYGELPKIAGCSHQAD